MRVLTHIVPYFAPTIDGVGDYALILGRHLRDTHGWDSEFVVCDPDWNGPEAVEGFRATKIAQRDGLTLAEKIERAPKILLHYVGYGYQPRGVPFWLANAILEQPRKMVTVFHEIWSKGPPWRSVFYLANAQKQLVSDFLEASDRAFTSTLNSVRLLEEIQKGKTQWLPIPSNLAPASAIERRRGKGWSLLIFGQQPTRARATQWHTKLISALHLGGHLEEVIVAGKDARRESEEIAALEEFLPTSLIRVVGEIKDAGIFSEVDAYLSPHRACDACKSGALMASLASGCPAILADKSNPAPLVADQQALFCDGSPASVARLIAKKALLPEIGAGGRDWYLKNADWPIVSARIAEAL